jgi:hypothetical protein
MFHGLGFASFFLPPLAVFILVVLEVAKVLTVPVWALVALYPLGTLTLVISSLTYRSSSLAAEHFSEYTLGARSATFLVFFCSVTVAILPVYLGEPFLGIGLLFVSLGSLWLPISSTAAVYGKSLMSARGRLSTPEEKGTPHRRIEGLFLALFLGEKDLLKHKWRETIIIMYLGASYVLGWVLLSQAGGFPASLIGVSMIVLVPLSSYKLFATVVKPGDRAKVKDLLKSLSSSAPSVAK